MRIDAQAQGEDAVTDHPTPDDATGPALDAEVPNAAPDRPLTAAARRALQEAAERRAAAGETGLPIEHGGPRGPEPTRYGDWEKKGLAVDF